MQFKSKAIQHFEAPKQPKLTPQQQRMEQLWGTPVEPPVTELWNDWDNYPDDDQ